MRKLACLLVLLSLGVFIAGCGGKDEGNNGDNEAEQENGESGQGVKVDKGDTQEIDDPTSIIGGDKKDPAEGSDKKDPAEGTDKKGPAEGSDKKDPTDSGDKKDPPEDDDTGLKLEAPMVTPPKIDSPDGDKKDGEDSGDKPTESKKE